MPSYSTTLFFYRWRRWSYVKVNFTFLNGTMYFFSMILLPIFRRIQRPTTQGHSSHAKYENSRKIIYVPPARKLVFPLQLRVAQCCVFRYRGMKCKNWTAHAPIAIQRSTIFLFFFFFFVQEASSRCRAPPASYN